MKGMVEENARNTKELIDARTKIKELTYSVINLAQNIQGFVEADKEKDKLELPMEVKSLTVYVTCRNKSLFVNCIYIIKI